MMSWLHLTEVVCLVLSAGALTVAVQKRSRSAARISGALALGFAGVYLLKLGLIPTLRYPGTGQFRMFYLAVLALHALLAPVGLSLMAAAFYQGRRGDGDVRFWIWLRRARPPWGASAAAGLVSVLLFLAA